MKKIISVIVMFFGLLLSVESFGQIHIDSLYENKGEFLIYSKIQEFDSIPKSEFPKRIKNWAGTKFVKMTEVLVSETEDQIVFAYISSAFFLKGMMGERSGSNDWYIRMVIQMKDNKIKISMYDDGNAMNAYSQARVYKLSNSFSKKGIAPKLYADGLMNLRLSCIEFTNGLIESIRKDSNKSKDDW